MKEHCRFWDGMRIVYFPILDKIVAMKCSITLHLFDEIIKTWTIDEFEKIDDIYSELNSLIKVWPEKHHTEIMEGRCPIKEKCCWCEPEEIKFKHIEVSLLFNCNLNCRFCGAKENRDRIVDPNKKERLKKLYFKTLNDIKGHNLEYIRLTDQGEPFFAYNETVDYLKSLTVNDCKQVQITTNGTLISDEVLDIIKNSEVDICLTVSINSYSQDHYKNKMGSDFFNSLIKKVDILNKNKSIFKISFLIDEIDENELNNYIPVLNDFLKRHIWFGIYPENKKANEIMSKETYRKLYDMSVESIRQFSSDVWHDKYTLKLISKELLTKDFF